MTIRITVRLMMRSNWPAIVGGPVANSAIVMSTLTIASPRPGTPYLFIRPKTLGNMPSSAAALADCPTSNIHPPRAPSDLRIAHTPMITIPVVPTAIRAASAKGAWEDLSSAFGTIPIITVQLRRYTTVEMASPRRVARGILRLGLSMTPAETAALSTPMKAHSATEAAREMACIPEPPVTFQPAMKVVGLNQNQPRKAIAKMGMRARLTVQVSRAPTTRGPRILAKVRAQITTAAATALGHGSLILGINAAKY